MYLSLQKMNFVECSETFATNLFRLHNFGPRQFQMEQFFQFLGDTHVSLRCGEGRCVVDVIKWCGAYLFGQTAASQANMTAVTSVGKNIMKLELGLTYYLDYELVTFCTFSNLPKRWSIDVSMFMRWWHSRSKWGLNRQKYGILHVFIYNFANNHITFSFFKV